MHSHKDPALSKIKNFKIRRTNQMGGGCQAGENLGVFWVHALPPVCYDSGTRGHLPSPGALFCEGKGQGHCQQGVPGSLAEHLRCRLPSCLLGWWLPRKWRISPPAALQINICAGGLWQLCRVVGLVSLPPVVPGPADGAVNLTQGDGLPGRTVLLNSALWVQSPTKGVLPLHCVAGLDLKALPSSSQQPEQ